MKFLKHNNKSNKSNNIFLLNEIYSLNGIYNFKLVIIWKKYINELSFPILKYLWRSLKTFTSWWIHMNFNIILEFLIINMLNHSHTRLVGRACQRPGPGHWAELGHGSVQVSGQSFAWTMSVDRAWPWPGLGQWAELGSVHVSGHSLAQSRSVEKAWPGPCQWVEFGPVNVSGHSSVQSRSVGHS